MKHFQKHSRHQTETCTSTVIIVVLFSCNNWTQNAKHPKLTGFALSLLAICNTAGGTTALIAISYNSTAYVLQRPNCFSLQRSSMISRLTCYVRHNVR